jgi:hypothetical protein
MGFLVCFCQVGPIVARENKPSQGMNQLPPFSHPPQEYLSNSVPEKKKIAPRPECSFFCLIETYMVFLNPHS